MTDETLNRAASNRPLNFRDQTQGRISMSDPTSKARALNDSPAEEIVYKTSRVGLPCAHRATSFRQLSRWRNPIAGVPYAQMGAEKRDGRN
jgi:hypothetical protein